MEHGEEDLANKANDILEIHRGKEKILFKKLVHQFGGVLKYYNGVKKRRAQKSETKSTKSRKSNAGKSKSSSSKAKAKASTAAIVPHTDRRTSD